jgi:cytochrome oxidase Cu insertion factor (SCO1/SenC/PrrC family)
MIGFIRAIVLSSIVIALVAGSAGTIGAQKGSEAAPQPMIGTAAPGFELQSIGGDTLSLAGLRGKFVVIHFGASW